MAFQNDMPASSSGQRRTGGDGKNGTSTVAGRGGKDMSKGTYGKDHPENFITGSLRGGQGASNGIRDIGVARDNQFIKEPTPMDNVRLAGPNIDTSIFDGKFGGSVTNVGHSLTGSGVPEGGEYVAEGGKRTIIPNH